jgi:Kdo2-lipid IVA lauroyltransferase/acyltransferase
MPRNVPGHRAAAIGCSNGGADPHVLPPMMSTNAKRLPRPSLQLILWSLHGLALALFWGCCACMSPERAGAFGTGLGRALGPRSHRHRRLKTNLAIALPRASNEELAATAQEVWGSFGAMLAEYAHLETIADHKFDQHVEVVVQPGVEACRGDGRPFVFVTAHLGNWDISAAVARHLGMPMTAVYSRQANPITDWLVQRRRRSLGCGFLANDDGMRPLLNELRAGRSVGLVVDLSINSGALVPFCGHDARTTLVPARLALKFGCPLVPVRVERTRPAHLRVTLHDPVLPDDAVAPDLRAWRMTARINALFESWIVARPGQWQCFQNRWPKATRQQAVRARALRQPAP